ncbi:hypothetical protein C7H84_23700 [Burkholderia sp. Nafp2/4-1b]|uniref:hypothetical protein n=1 Tax=Burkholderia sp. Nafp2/4-1b TaxID=2116686 RepID=UPI000EF8FD41|nr:hypothetical protein [Burkholderia sp. Nafp2/4-1b]RKU00690.1 hypothetical protein C7H84_23700 [Burkholderia sp. Nafp2/4-1b]
MSFFKRKVEELQTKRAERESLKSLEDAFGKSLGELQTIFGSGALDPEQQKLPAYPKPIYQGDAGINAFGLVHHVQPCEFPAFLNLVRQGRDEITYFHFIREVNTHSLSTIISPTWRFAERVVRLLSNDVELIAKLSEQGFQPTPPWITLYEFGPVLHISQGDPHYWLNHVWDSFWESLSLDEQTRFLEEGRKETSAYISAEDWELWVESIRMRDVRFRKLDD